MGRSRLAYRSKHKGILSENSRRAIREAHEKRRSLKETHSNANVIKTVMVDEEDEMQKLDKYSEELEEELSTIDIMDFPPIFVRTNEITEYQQEIGLNELNEQKKDLIFPV